jgi:hypothetical protein
MRSIFTKGKNLSPSRGGRTKPLTVSPSFKPILLDLLLVHVNVIRRGQVVVVAAAQESVALGHDSPAHPSVLYEGIEVEQFIWRAISFNSESFMPLSAVWSYMDEWNGFVAFGRMADRVVKSVDFVGSNAV